MLKVYASWFYTPEIFAVELNIDGKKTMAIVKDIQFQPVTDAIMHMDFMEVSDSKPVTIEVPVVLTGHAEGVKAGGKLTLRMRKLKVKAIYTQIPEKLTINVDHLGLGKSMQVGAFTLRRSGTDECKERCCLRRSVDSCRSWCSGYCW